MGNKSAKPPTTKQAPQKLTNNDLELLVDTLNPVASKCYVLGIQLGLDDYPIRSIIKIYKQNKDRLREIILARLRQEPPLTWHDIARALRADSVSENSLASEIENKYIPHLPPPASLAPQANTSFATSSLIPSLQSASQCHNSPLSHSAYSVKHPLHHSLVRNKHTLDSTQVTSPTTCQPTTVSTHSLTSSAYRLAFMQANTCSDPLSVRPPLQPSFLTQCSGAQHQQLPALPLSVSTGPTDCLIHQRITVEVINRHTSALTAAIGNDINHFSNKFIELRFLSRTAADEILTKLGIGNGEKGRQLLNCVIASCMRSLQKEWFNKFVGVFLSEAAYTDLANRMIEDYSKHSNYGSSPAICHSMPPQPVPIALSPLTTAHPVIHALPSSQPSLPMTAQSLGVQPYSSVRPWDIPSPFPHHPLPAHHQIPPHHSSHPSDTQHDPHLSSPSVPPLQEGVRGGQWNLQLHRPPSSQSQGSSDRKVKSQMFIDYVKTIYKESEVERDTRVVKWPPTPSTVYINLALINRNSISGMSKEYAEITEAMVRDGNVDVINTTKGPIKFNEIIEGISISLGTLTDSQATQRRLILVEGAPGVGKSTFAREFCRKWLRGQIGQQYHLVLLLRLRDNRISKAKSLKDLVYHPLEGVSQAVSEELILSYNFNALIILEGFDELPDHCRNDQSIFFQLIAGQLLPLATVLVTSRPWATERIFGNRISRHIEILGFTSQQIAEYIERALPLAKVNDLKDYLEKHPQIRMGMYIPLNSAIVVTVYQESLKSGCALPTTLTELYTAMVQTLLFRYLRGHPQYETATMRAFNDLPPAVHTKFLELCKLAYRGIVGNSDHVQLIFTDLPSDFDNLGLMDSVTDLYVTQGAVSSHNFLHLTFQEYFAAVHISTLSPAEQLEHFQRYKEGRFNVVLRFLAGLNKLNCFAKENVHHFLTPSLVKCSSPYSIPVDVSVTADLVNWMFEAQSSDIIALVLEKKTAEFNVTQCRLPLDYYRLGYCIGLSQCQWVLLVPEEGPWHIYDMREENVRMLAAGANITQQPTGRVVQLKGGGQQTEQQPNSWMAGLNKTEQQPSSSVVGLSEEEQWPSSRVMDLSEEKQQPSGLVVQKYEREHPISDKVLKSSFEFKSVLYLHELALRLPTVTDSITWSALSALRVLSLEVDNKASWKLGTVLPHLSLESLTLRHCSESVSLVLEDCVAIADHLTSTQNLKELCFGYKHEFHTAIDITTHEHSMVEVIGETGLEAMTKALTGNQSLQLERLDWKIKCTFTDTAADCLAQFISNTTTLQYIRIWWCTFSAHGLLELAKAIHNHSTLQEKSLRYLACTVNGDNEAKDFAQLLVKYPQVGGIWKYKVIITKASNTGAMALAQALHQNSTLEMLELSNSGISDAVAVALAKALHHNSTLTSLDLSNNSISDTGAVALAQALHHNSTLEWLHLDGNDDIGEKGTQRLVQALTGNTAIASVGCLVLPKKCEDYVPCEVHQRLSVYFIGRTT